MIEVTENRLPFIGKVIVWEEGIAAQGLGEQRKALTPAELQAPGSRCMSGNVLHLPCVSGKALTLANCYIHLYLFTLICSHVFAKSDPLGNLKDALLALGSEVEGRELFCQDGQDGASQTVGSSLGTWEGNAVKRRHQSQGCHLMPTGASYGCPSRPRAVGLASGMENRKLSSEEA